MHNLDFDCNLLPLLSGMKPVVWTLHDPWLFSGHCIHSFGCDKWRTGCGDCPHLDVPFSRDFDRSAIDFEAKRIAIRDSQITFIVASDWMLEKAKCSPVTAGKKIVKIPFGIDQGLFKCKSRADIRRKLGIAEDAFVLFFRADRNPYKGADTIKTA